MREGFLRVAMTLCGIYDFAGGYLYTCEHLNQFQAVVSLAPKWALKKIERIIES
jgi:hypothetical protein